MGAAGPGSPIDRTTYSRGTLSPDLGSFPEHSKHNGLSPLPVWLWLIIGTTVCDNNVAA